MPVMSYVVSPFGSLLFLGCLASVDERVCAWLIVSCAVLVDVPGRLTLVWEVDQRGVDLGERGGGGGWEEGREEEVVRLLSGCIV